MEYVILGLLMIRDLTVYEIRNVLLKKDSPLYSASYGSIQSAIKKLLAWKNIVFSEIIENGRGKKVYSINEAGKKYFLQWLEADINVKKFKHDTLTKIFFFGFLSTGRRIELIENYIKKLTVIKNGYKNLYAKNTLKQVPENQIDIARYQLTTLEYAIDLHNFEINWYISFLKKMKGE